ncbi:hypothetical protein ColKHC_11349 [Colletotrichum higginsianum]|nr:hypothetical protein ColKHC_11349 [Colletotrichum higginsianum]
MLSTPYSFASAARARIQWLENIIIQRLPDVDISQGPQIDAFPDPKGSVSGGGGFGGCIGSEAGGTAVEPRAPQRIGLKRPAEAVDPSFDPEEQFPDRAQAVAMNLGMLSLNSDSSQKHYLGSSSGVLFTNLIGVTPSSAGSTPATLLDDVQAQGPSSEWHDAPSCAPGNVSQQYNRSLHIFLRQELPKKEDAVKLVHTYIRWTHPDYPVLEPSSLLSALDAIYATYSCSIDEDPLPQGWPSSVQAFRWNGRQSTLGGDPAAHAVPMPVVAFILFMIFNIAAIVKVRSRVYEFPPERFYRAALHFSKDCFSQISLSSIQALVTLIVHSMLTPAEVNLFTLVHIGLAHCVELGIHREPPPATEPDDVKNQQIKRLTFFTMYSLDRSISSIQGRPLGFRDETFDVKMPEPQSPRRLSATSSPMLSSFSAAVVKFARCQFELDRIISDIKLQLYHLPCDSAWFAPAPDPTLPQTRIKGELVGWWDRVSKEPFSFPGLDNRQRRMWQLKLKIKYHTAMVMLFQPSQAVRNPPPESLHVCFDNASSILQDYQALYEMQGLHHGWRTVQNIFAAGATLIYSFWTCPMVRQTASTADLSRSLRACSGLLTVGGEWWPSHMQGSSLGMGTAQDAVHWQGVYRYPDGSFHPAGNNSSSGNNNNNNSNNNNNNNSGDDYVPEIETFLADFDRSEFSWSFPLSGISDPYDLGNFPHHGY